MKKYLRIAIADANRASLERIHRAIDTSNHKVCAVAANGPQLVEQARKQAPDLIVADMSIPMAHVDEAVAQLTSQAVAVILISEADDVGTPPLSLPRWVFGHLIKPIGEANLQTTIALAMQRSGALYALHQETARLRAALG